VEDQRDGAAILREVCEVLNREGVALGTTSLPPLRLVGQDELDGLGTQRSERKAAGVTRSSIMKIGDRTVKCDAKEVLILHGLPREHFAATAAHELGHVWLLTNRVLGLPSIDEEGLCELCQYLWLKQRKGPRAEYRIRSMEQNDDPVYGDGFRLARNAVEHISVVTLLAYVRAHKRLPRPHAQQPVASR